jgi:N-acetylmuramoyl-L-alanine amidase
MLIFAPSPNFDDRASDVGFLVLHYTGMRSGAEAVGRLCDPGAKVSSHYVVEEDGRVFKLVEEEKRAWHAGVSYWRGVSGLNDTSIGVEIVNPGHEWGYRAFPDAQVLALLALCVGILGRHEIPARNVVGHSDVAPDRKQDPGELFPWRWFAERGVGVWTDDFLAPGDLMGDLAAIGYDTRLPAADVVRAFQRHFLPENVTGVGDEGRAAVVGRGGGAAGLRDLLKTG